MRCLFLILAVIYCGFLVAQVPDSAVVWSDRNEVYNPSFEQYTECPRKIDAMGVLTIVEGWYQPTAGSADYFNRCGARVCAVPDNKMGSRVPHSGDAYCGVYCSKNEYREYLQTELRGSMRKGHRYQVAFWVALSHRSPMAVASLGALITPNRVVDTGDGILMYRDRKQLSDNSYQTISTYYNPQISIQPIGCWIVYPVGNWYRESMCRKEMRNF